MSTFQLGSPMWRFTERMVRSTLVTAWRLATSPTSTSPFLAKATTLGVVREPSEFAMTSGSPPDRTETTELVVPRSIPTARAMDGTPLCGRTCGSMGLVQSCSSVNPAVKRNESARLNFPNTLWRGSHRSFGGRTGVAEPLVVEGVPLGQDLAGLVVQFERGA